MGEKVQLSLMCDDAKGGCNWGSRQIASIQTAAKRLSSTTFIMQKVSTKIAAKRPVELIDAVVVAVSTSSAPPAGSTVDPNWAKNLAGGRPFALKTGLDPKTSVKDRK